MSRVERSLKFVNLPQNYNREELMELLEKAGVVENIVYMETECIVTFESESECGFAEIY